MCGHVCLNKNLYLHGVLVVCVCVCVCKQVQRSTAEAAVWLDSNIPVETETQWSGRNKYVLRERQRERESEGERERERERETERDITDWLFRFEGYLSQRVLNKFTSTCCPYAFKSIKETYCRPEGPHAETNKTAIPLSVQFTRWPNGLFHSDSVCHPGSCCLRLMSPLKKGFIKSTLTSCC